MRHLKFLRIQPLNFILIAIAVSCAQAQQAAFIKVEFPGTASSMVEDNEGALWIGAEEGLFYFDGVRFLKVDLGLGKKDHVIRSVAKSEDGCIWATSLGGLFRVQPHSNRVSLERQVFGIGVDIYGQYIAHVEGDGFGGNLAVGVYRDGVLKMTRYDTIYFNGAPKFDSAGNLVGGCGDDVCSIPAVEIQKAAQGTLPKIERVPLLFKMARRSVLRDRAGCLWFRSESRAGYRCPADKQFQLLPLDVAETTQFNSINLDSKDRVWLLSDSGMVSFGQAGKLRTLTTKNAMPRMVQVVHETRDGSIWMGGPGALWRFVDPERLELWSERDGISLYGHALTRGASGEMLLGGSSGLLRLNRDRTRWEPFGDQKEMRLVRALFPTTIGTTLVSSTYTGILELDSTGKTLRRTAGRVVRFGAGGATETWTGGIKTQLLQFGPKGLKFLMGPESVNLGSGVAFQRDNKGRTWHCTIEGLARFDPTPKTYRQWTTKDGLINNLCRAIAVSPDGDQVWYGYQRDAFSKLDFSGGDEPKITHFTSDSGYHFADFIDFDKRGWLWRGGQGANVSDGKHIGLDDWVNFNESDGFPVKDEINHISFIDPDGSLWFHNQQIVYHYKPPGDLFTRKVKPTVFLSSPPANELKNGQQAKFEFGSLYYELRNQLRFRYRLNAAQQWTVTKETAKTFENLPPGQYQFELAARVLPTGDWTVPVSYKFRVIAPFWQTSIFLGLLVVGGLGITGGVLGLRGRRKSIYMQQKQAFLCALENEQNTADPEIQRLLTLSKTPTHLPDLSPWQGGGVDREMPAEVDGRFDIQSVVAAGGFATVYLAHDKTRKGSRCAVKIFHLSEHEREWMLKRFDQEIESLKRIDHPNVVRFLSAGETSNGEPYLAMDFVEGITLRQALIDGALTRPLAADLVLQLGAALEAIHKENVFHRDIKPENLILTPQRRLLVIDFSIAIARDPRSTQHALSRAAGSFLYMAPEQVFGFASPATDIYSFALVVFEILTGKRAGDLGLGAASGSLPGEVRRSLQELCPGLPPADELAEALMLEPRQRPQAAGHFGERLAEWIMS